MQKFKRSAFSTKRSYRSNLRLKGKLKKTKFLVPNLVTVGNMFCGFLAVIYATSDRFEKAVIALAIAFLLDGVDGNVARRLNATSKFGLEFDSLSDLVSFGVAPAILIYNWCYRFSADEFGVAVCFLYVVSVATRLARFNVRDSGGINFTGLPSPAGAGAVTALVYFSTDMITSVTYISLVTVHLIATSLLMVSNFEYLSIKKTKLVDIKPGLPILSLLIGILWYNNKFGFLIITVGYVLSGPLGYLRNKKLAAFKGKSKS